MIVFSRLWWLCVLLLLISCNAATAPTMGNYQVDGYVEPWVSNTYGNAQGLCDPGGDDDNPLSVPKVELCFRQFFEALAIGGVTAGLCLAEIRGAPSKSAAIAKGSACGLGLLKTSDAFGVWLDATQVDGYVDWSEREIDLRMKEAIFARMWTKSHGGESPEQ